LFKTSDVFSLFLFQKTAFLLLFTPFPLRVVPKTAFSLLFNVLFFTPSPLLFVRFTFFKRVLFVAKPFLTRLLQKKTVFNWGTPFFQTVLALDKVWVFV
jgi:hypothetical protein